MSWRRLPPVHSPLPARALLAGGRAAVRPEAATAARAEIERWLTARLAPRAMLLLDSGTSALGLALRMAVPAGGRVALPAWGCYDLATACDGAGVEVLLYDLDPRTLAPDWTSLRAALGAGAGAVVAVHFYGLPVPMDQLQGVAAESGAVVIEDAAQAAGAALGGVACGALGELAVLSFGRGKGVTGGRGGALLAHGERWVSALRAGAELLPAPSAGWGDLPKAAAQALLARPALYAVPAALPMLRLGETIYHPAHEPAPMPRSALGILSATAPLAASEAVARRAVAMRWRAMLGSGGAIQVVEPHPDAEPGYLRFPVRAASGPRLSARPGAASLGVMPGYPRVLAELPGFARRVRNAAATRPGAAELAARLDTLPCHGQVGPGDLERLQRWLGS